MTALQTALELVSSGRLPADAVGILFTEAFPAFDEKKIARMVAIAKKFTPTTTGS